MERRAALPGRLRAEEDFSVLIGSPYASHPGHFWNYAEQVALALRHEGSERVAIVLQRPPARSPVAAVEPLVELAPGWVRQLFKALIPWLEERPRLAGLVRPLETIGTASLLSFHERTTRATVFHLIDGTFFLLWLWALVTGRGCVCNLMGGPEPVMSVPFFPKPLSWIKRKLTRKLLDACIRRGQLEFCAETAFIRDEWRPLVGAHVTHIPYAVSDLPDPMPRLQARVLLKLPTAKAVFLVYGTQRVDKDIASVVRAAALLSPPPLLLFVGKHVSGPTPEAVLRDCGYQDARVVDRFVDDGESALYFAACDAVLLPYVEGYEKGSGVLVEACRHLRPVIATDSGHLRAFVHEHGNGLLFRYGDAGDLCRRMEDLLKLDEGRRTALATRIAAAAQRHTWTEIIKQYLALYAKLRKNSERIEAR